jgi:hypothetical protein
MDVSTHQTLAADCQSCGMPLSRDEQGGGTNSDGSKSVEYCSHCYRAGAFTTPSLTVLEMQQRVETKLKELALPPAFVEAQIQRIPTLKRWSR